MHPRRACSRGDRRAWRGAGERPRGCKVAARRRLPLMRTRLPLAALQLAAQLAALPLLAALPRVAAAGVIVPDRGGPPLSLRREVATVEVDNQLARTTLDQVFENRTDHPTGGTYA